MQELSLLNTTLKDRNCFVALQFCLCSLRVQFLPSVGCFFQFIASGPLLGSALDRAQSYVHSTSTLRKGGIRQVVSWATLSNSLRDTLRPIRLPHLNLIYQRKVWYFLGCHNLWKWMSLIKLMGSAHKWLEINIKWGQYTDCHETFGLLLDVPIPLGWPGGQGLLRRLGSAMIKAIFRNFFNCIDFRHIRAGWFFF